MATNLLDLPETATRLNLSIRTIRRWATEGRLPVVRLGRRVLVNESALEAWIRAKSQPAREAA